LKRQSNQNETDKQPISGNYCQNGRNLSFQTELDRHDKLLYIGHLRAGSKRNYPIEMSSLETLLKRADELAQDVIDAWNASAANLSPEFKTLLHKTFLYKATRQIAENHRVFDILSDRDKGKEGAAGLIFVRAYKIYCHRQAARFN